jgi:hypothetical protein
MKLNTELMARQIARREFARQLMFAQWLECIPASPYDHALVNVPAYAHKNVRYPNQRDQS